jgi:hypothetical protein
MFGKFKKKGAMMNRNIVVLLVVGAILLGSIATCMVVRANEPQPDVQWEYKTLRMGLFTDAEQTLNEYAKQGWEVVDWEDTNSVYFLLKRQL